MTESETESFELHFFECRACAAEVEAVTIFQETARAALAEQRQKEPARVTAWWQRLAFAAPALATLVLAGVSIYQQQELARLRAPQGLLAFTVQTARRAEEPITPIRLPAGTHSFEINLDLPPSVSGYPRYHCELSGPARLTFDSPQAGDQLHLSIPTAGLRPGVYTLRVRGVRDQVTGPEDSYHFAVQFQ